MSGALAVMAGGGNSATLTIGAAFNGVSSYGYSDGALSASCGTISGAVKGKSILEIFSASTLLFYITLNQAGLGASFFREIVIQKTDGTTILLSSSTSSYNTQTGQSSYQWSNPGAIWSGASTRFVLVRY